MFTSIRDTYERRNEEEKTDGSRIGGWTFQGTIRTGLSQASGQQDHGEAVQNRAEDHGSYSAKIVDKVEAPSDGED
jgi:hypothetical protein